MEQSFTPVTPGRAGALLLAAGALMGLALLDRPTAPAADPASVSDSVSASVSASDSASDSASVSASVSVPDDDQAQATAAEAARDWLRAARARARIFARTRAPADRRRLLAACARGVAVGFGAPTPVAAADRLDELLLPWRDDPRVDDALVAGYRALARHAMDRNDAAEGRDLVRRLRLLGREDDAREVERLVDAEERWMRGPSGHAPDHDH